MLIVQHTLENEFRLTETKRDISSTSYVFENWNNNINLSSAPLLPNGQVVRCITAPCEKGAGKKGEGIRFG